MSAFRYHYHYHFDDDDNLVHDTYDHDNHVVSANQLVLDNRAPIGLVIHYVNRPNRHDDH